MSDLVTLSKDGDVAVVTINNPPVNALSPGVPEGVIEHVQAAGADPSVKAIVLIGGGRTFVAGADIKEFGKITSGQKKRDQGLHPMLTVVENCPKPVVCAIHGTAFGGGLELAQACHYRVAVPNSQVGQPEVKLGLIPGGAGTQRLPRLAGIVHAAELCAIGNPISAKQAPRVGHHRRAGRRRLAGRRGEIRPVERGQAAAEGERDPRPLWRAGGRRGGHRRTQEAGRQNVAGHAVALSRDRGGRSGRQAAVCRRGEERGRALSGMPLLQRIEIADSRLLRRADGRQDSRPAQRHQADRSEDCGRHRRGHDGRRHHDDLRECRHSGDAQRGRSAGPRPRPGDDQTQLRRFGAAGQDDAGPGRSEAGDDQADAQLRATSARRTSSSKPCSRTWS